MITPGRRGGALLLGIATGGLMISGVAVAASPTIASSSLRTLLAAEESSLAAPAAPASRPAWRTAAPAPVAVALPAVAAAVPAAQAPALPVPAPAEVPPPVAAAPEPAPAAVPVREVRAAESADEPDDSDSESDESGSDGSSGNTAEVIERTNKERRDAGCGALKPDARLTRAAQAHASDMAENGYFSHHSEDGTRFDSRIRAEGYSRPGGENIARGQGSAEQVVDEWMASPSHRSHIENCAFTTIGVGYDDRYWVQDFGR